VKIPQQGIITNITLNQRKKENQKIKILTKIKIKLQSPKKIKNNLQLKSLQKFKLKLKS
jgi:hypothetical protein